MKICAIVVLFNPDKNVFKNILTYNSFFEKIIIVDNSKENNEKYILNKNYIYIPNNKNLGIAAALNIGCKKAQEENFDFVMTMDQDSSWKKSEIKNYIIFAEKILQNKNENKIESISPSLNLKHSSLYDFIYYFLNFLFHIIKKRPEYEYFERVITSGNILSLECWEKSGKFNENLFIDEVDFEFCYRLIKNDYKIIRYNKAKINHLIGNSNFSIFRKDKHNSTRLYYIVRNCNYIIKKYPDFAEKYEYDKKLKMIYNEYCKKNKMADENKKIYEKAVEDSNKM